MIEFSSLSHGPDGLVVAVIQDDNTGDVLMVGYMDAAALAATYETGLVHFWSRSRSKLWQKGETSGNTLELRSIVSDCDHDALLLRVTPNGPTCHTGSDSCFGPTHIAETTSLGSVVDRLTAIIADRVAADQTDSYTARLLADPDLAARKVLEEAGEVAFAAKDVHHGAPTSRVVEEAADALYHLLVLMQSADASPADVAAELDRRMG